MQNVAKPLRKLPFQASCNHWATVGKHFENIGQPFRNIAKHCQVFQALKRCFQIISRRLVDQNNTLLHASGLLRGNSVNSKKPSNTESVNMMIIPLLMIRERIRRPQDRAASLSSLDVHLKQKRKSSKEHSLSTGVTMTVQRLAQVVPSVVSNPGQIRIDDRKSSYRAEL